MHRFLPVLLVVFALLTGCLRSETTVELREDGSGRISVRYEIDTVAYDTGAFGSEAAGRIVPVTERDFTRAALQLDGLSLRRYRSSRDDDTVVVTAVLDFDSVSTLERFLGVGSVEVELSDSGGRWSQIIAPGRTANEGDEALAQSLESYSLVFSLEPPGRVVTATGGQVAADRRSARIAVGLGEIVLADEPIIWSVEW